MEVAERGQNTPRRMSGTDDSQPFTLSQDNLSPLIAYPLQLPPSRRVDTRQSLRRGWRWSKTSARADDLVVYATQHEVWPSVVSQLPLGCSREASAAGASPCATSHAGTRAARPCCAFTPWVVVRVGATRVSGLRRGHTRR